MSTSDVVSAATVPSRDELVERARGLRPLLWESASQADLDREVSQEVGDAIADAGLFKLMVPKRLGGYETDARTMLEVLAELGKGCVSAAWIGSVLNFAAWQCGLFTEQAQRDVFEDNPDARLCWVLSPAVEVKPSDGGITATGKWPNASGSSHCDWAALALPAAFGPQGPEFSMVVVPMSDLTIEDTWYIAGVRGSASNTIVAQDVFIPEHRIMPMMPAMNGVNLSGHPEEALYRSVWSIGGLALLAPQLGAAAAMLEYVLDASKGKMIPAAGVMDQSEWSPFQIDVAEAASKIDAAWLLARRTADDIDEWAQRGEIAPTLIRARARADHAWASKQIKEAAEILMTEAGVSAFLDASPLQRMWRDISVSNGHTAFRLKPPQELYGKALLGKEIGPMFLA